MKGLFEDLASHFRKNQDELPDEVIQGFLRVLESVRLQEMPCREVFARLDEYVEKELTSREAASLMPLLREHFDVCPDCCEEYEALMRALEHSSLSGKPGSPATHPSA